MEQEITSKVQDVLTAALGVDRQEVRPESALSRDLGAESIDYIDIIFRLEKAFDIKIPSGELFPGNILNDDRYVQNGVVTPAGLDELKAKVPYLDIAAFARDPQVTKLSNFFTVQMIMNYIQDRLAKEVKA
ncbi:MAG: acyl carrier protein [Candidatus Omnitrophica bacterium]|nr:acyl carrier protein [Candidatus Omnitrophota bacterium]